MTMSQPADQLQAAFDESVSHHWGWFLVEGLLLVFLGLLAILLPTAASLAATVVVGWLLLLSGVMGLIQTIRARRAPGFGWSLLSALLALGAGAMLLIWPLRAVFSLTAVLIAFLFAEGVITVFYALDHRRGYSGRWGWMLASGLIDILLGVILLAGLPGTALWALGLLLGINLCFGGWALIAMALAARSHSTRTGQVAGHQA
jgi:uncharacterized membrane protein HdeD (DUF308 family)